jgi:SOS-response transcriptional repressor LexA
MVKKGLIQVKYLGFILAGDTNGNVVNFKSKAKIEVPIPPDAEVTDRFAACDVRGNSMALCGILDGDRIICRTNVKLEDIETGKVVLVERERQLYLKKVTADREGRIFYTAANERQAEEIMTPGEATFRGVVKLLCRFYTIFLCVISGYIMRLLLCSCSDCLSGFV